MKHFTVSDLPLSGLKLVRREQRDDNRGFFSRLFCAEELAAVGWSRPVAQINHSLTTQRGIVRGLHFQRAPHAEMKLVSCIRGKVWDVAVDVRVDSPTFMCWHTEELTEENRNAMLIPEGFAHGFQALSDNVEVIYCTSEFYYPHFERGLNPRDPRLAIKWPLNITLTSSKDADHPYFERDFQGAML